MTEKQKQIAIILFTLIVGLAIYFLSNKNKKPVLVSEPASAATMGEFNIPELEFPGLGITPFDYPLIRQTYNPSTNPAIPFANLGGGNNCCDKCASGANNVFTQGIISNLMYNAMGSNTISNQINTLQQYGTVNSFAGAAKGLF